MNLYSLSVLLFAFGVLLIALVALMKKRDRMTLCYAGFSVSGSGWGFLYTIWTGYEFSYEITYRLVVFSEMFAVFIPSLWLHFVLEFVEKREPIKHFYRMNYVIAFVMALLCLSPWFFNGLQEVPVFGYYKSPGPIFYLFFCQFLLYVSYAVYQLVKAYLEAWGEKRLQLKYLLIGWIIAFLGGLSTFLAAFKITDFYFLILSMPLYPIFTGIAIIRYGLFDVRELVDAFQKNKLAAIGTLSTSINHEIRNPLYIIQGLADSALLMQQEAKPQGEGEPNGKFNEVLGKISAQSQRAIEIMKDFSRFAKSPVSEHAAMEAVAPEDVMREVEPLVRHELRLERIKLTQDVSQDLPACYADRRHLEEILFNLIVNACQAIKTSGQGDEVKFTASSRNGFVIIAIEDNGPGISQEAMGKVFEPFYTTKTEGTGLGLYITKQLVEKNGGRISVESKEGRGTKVTLEFKRV